jgi:Holliday junction resolvase RusA-like endonuclease
MGEQGALGLEPQRKPLRFHVPGEVRGKNDPRSRIVEGVRKDTGEAYKFVSHYTDKKTRSVEAKIGQYAMKAKGEARWDLVEDRPLRVEIIAIFNVPASWSKKKTAAAQGAPATCKPDGDNISKSFGDACQGILFKDDKQIADTRIIKLYAQPGQGEGLYITVSELG